MESGIGNVPSHNSAQLVMPNRLEEDVRSAYARATEGTGSPDELLSAVRTLVRDLKREGRPPEKVLVTVKEVCGLPLITFAADTDAAADATPAKQISEMMVRAAIDEYYTKPRPNGLSSDGHANGLGR
jgi:hypothetical protein